MKTFKDQGITFKQFNINEADTIYSILTKYHGRVDAIAKGIRKPTSRKAGNIDLITLSNFHFAKGKNLDIITEATLIENHDKLKRKLKSTLILFYICELLDSFIQKGESQRKTYDLLIELLNALKLSKNNFPLTSFELKLMSEHGYEPNLYSCLKCNDGFNREVKRYLAFDKLGFYCEKEKNTKGYEVSDRATKTLKFLMNNSIKNANNVKRDKILESEIEKITKRWIEQVLEKDIKSRKYIKE
jgi:DNA repair protein RecO (recombination protein O)